MERLLQEPLQQVTLDRRSAVAILSLQGNYYVKTFTGRGSRIKDWLRISRYRREVRNLEFFAAIGLRTPELVARGHDYRAGLLRRGMLVTAEVPAALDLEKLIRKDRLYEQGVAGARHILAQVATAARALHARGFYHKDLKPRNILVQGAGGDAQLFFFDCPSGHHPPRCLLRRGIVRDLAHLEEGLRGHVRRVDLLYMYRQYRHCEKLSGEDRALAREALNYHAQRRMTRKRRRRVERKRANGG